MCSESSCMVIGILNVADVHSGGLPVQPGDRDLRARSAHGSTGANQSDRCVDRCSHSSSHGVVGHMVKEIHAVGSRPGRQSIGDC